MHFSPATLSPSSVRVPVLSKTIIWTLPAAFMLKGLIQYIFLSLSLDSANMIPTLIAAGRAGGTEIVIKSKNLTIVSLVDKYFNETSTVHAHPNIDIKPIMATNFKASV